MKQKTKKQTVNFVILILNSRATLKTTKLEQFNNNFI